MEEALRLAPGDTQTRNNLANDVSAQLIEHFGDRMFRTVIPRNIRLAEAPSFGLPALLRADPRIGPEGVHEGDHGQLQLLRHALSQPRRPRQQARLGASGAIPRALISAVRPIGVCASVTAHFTTDA